MTNKDPRTPRVDPREPFWLSIVTILFCLGEGALITLVLLSFRAELYGLTARLASGTVAIPGVNLELVWLTVVVATTVFTLLGVLALARKATLVLLEATYTSSGPFRERKAATLSRLDQMIS